MTLMWRNQLCILQGVLQLISLEKPSDLWNRGVGGVTMDFCIWSVSYLSRHFFSLEYVFLTFILFELLYFVYVCLCSTPGVQKRSLDSLELELQATVSCQMWVQGIEFLFSDKNKTKQNPASILNWWVISPALIVGFQIICTIIIYLPFLSAWPFTVKAASLFLWISRDHSQVVVGPCESFPQACWCFDCPDLMQVSCR